MTPPRPEPLDEDMRRLLAAERTATLAEIAALTRDVERMVEATVAANTDDEHDPEGATIAFERAQVSALRDRAETRLADVDAALGRLDAGTFGVCESCARPIGAERLTARPTARECIDCARRRR